MPAGSGSPQGAARGYRLIAQRPAAAGTPQRLARRRLGGSRDSLEGFLGVLDDAGSPSQAGTTGGGSFGGEHGRPGGEAAVGRVLLALHQRDAEGLPARRRRLVTP